MNTSLLPRILTNLRRSARLGVIAAVLLLQLTGGFLGAVTINITVQDQEILAGGGSLGGTPNSGIAGFTFVVLTHNGAVTTPVAFTTPTVLTTGVYQLQLSPGMLVEFSDVFAIKANHRLMTHVVNLASATGISVLASGHLQAAASGSALSVDIVMSQVVAIEPRNAAGTLALTSLITAEGGTPANFRIRLKASPDYEVAGRTVTVKVASNNLTEGTVGPATLTFHPWPATDWRDGLPVTLTPLDDPTGVNPADGDITYTISSTVDGTVATKDAKFDPLSAGISVTNTDNDKPLDAVLVLDRSGSMSEASGATTKIQALANAGALFTDLLAPLNATAPTSNRLGVVSYNSAPSTLLSLGVLNYDAASGHHLSALDKFTAAAITDPARLKPQGSTAIGEGMVAGRNLMALTSADPNFTLRKRLLVVMSDGNENSGRTVHQVLTTSPDDVHFAAGEGTKRYSIGFGSDFTPSVLQEITNVVGSATDFSGYQHVEDATTTAGVALSAVYFKIFADAQSIAMPVDPTFQIPLIGDTQPIEVGRARLTSLDYQADLVILDEPVFRPWYTLELIDPKGRVVDASSTFGGNPVHIIRNANYALYRLVLPAPSVNSDHLGDWVIRLTPTKQPGGEATRAGAAATRRPERVPVGFAVATRSDFQLDFTAVPEARRPTTDIHLSARLLAHGVPTRGGNVRVRITPPGSPMQDLELHDDGQGGDQRANDGIHTAIFPRAARDGVYRFDARAVGHSDSGEQIPRELTRFVYLAPLADVVTPAGPTTGPRDPCCPAFWFGVAILALIALLLLILVLRRR